MPKALEVKIPANDREFLLEMLTQMQKESAILGKTAPVWKRRADYLERLCKAISQAREA